MSTSLHPNLARIAATYDEIFVRFRDGRTSAADARTEIAALVARDDEGTLWSIHPESGAWLYRTRSGALVEGTPPSFGLATPTAHDLSRETSAFNPDHNISFTKVDADLLYAPTGLAGSTRRPAPTVKTSLLRTAMAAPARVKALVAVAAVLLVVWVSGVADRPADDEPVKPAPTTTTMPVPAPPVTAPPG